MHTRTGRPHHFQIAGRGGFTLIELLVVIAIIAMLIGILLPAMGEARRTSQRIVSLANLRTNGLIMSAYSNDNNDDFVNPFTPATQCGGGLLGGTKAWVWVYGEECMRGWPYEPGYSTQGSESYGYHWIAHTIYTDVDTASRGANIYSPGDAALKNWLRENTDSSAQTDYTWIFPSSYWYPPVFWQSHTRFASFDRPIANRNNKFFFRRNKTTDVLYPAKKVMIFESKDYAAKDQPMWNNPKARPGVALSDGSGQTINMADVVADTDTIAGNDPDKLPFPSGFWRPGEPEMDNKYLYGKRQGFTWDYTRPAYFWATRNGVRGRDLR
jgi:prepilin-type N-terminal cleavage/methylation domain-containing protein